MHSNTPQLLCINLTAKTHCTTTHIAHRPLTTGAHAQTNRAQVAKDERTTNGILNLFTITKKKELKALIPMLVRRRKVRPRSPHAVYLNNNKDGIGLSGLEDFKNVQIGSLNVTPDKTGAVGADRVPPLLERYLTGLRISGPGNIAIKRS